MITEDKVLSGISESVFQSLMVKYEREHAEKAGTLETLTARLNAAAQDERNIDRRFLLRRPIYDDSE